MVLLKVSEISRDTTRFQFRSVEYDEQRVQWLFDHWNPAAVDPLDIWEIDGKYFLLSGHHRFETMLRKGVESCECRVHTFSLEQAQTFALKSNANRLSYSVFEYSRCITFLVEQQKQPISAAADEMTVSVGMAKKYYSLRFLVGTDWERQCEKLDLSARAYELGNFCEIRVKAGGTPLSQAELQSLFKIVVDSDLSTSQLKQLLRDIKRQQEKAQKTDGLSLFNLSEFGNDVVKAVKERDFLDKTSAQIWWLLCLIREEKEHQFPPELQAEFVSVLKKVHAYCIGSDDVEAEPTRATGKGRSLRVNLDKKAS